MSHWNLLITTVRFIKTITFNIGLILGGGGGSLWRKLHPHPILVNETPYITKMFIMALTIDHAGCGVVLTACVHGNWFSYLNRRRKYAES